MILNIPFTIAPLIIYNLVGLGLFGAYSPGFWTNPVFSVDMISGMKLTLELGHWMIVAGLLVLFVELLKATRSAEPSLYDHAGSLIVFIVYLVQFIAVSYCADGIFFLLLLIALIDVAAGFTISLRTARRETMIQRDL
jgi:hypothetical protein